MWAECKPGRGRGRMEEPSWDEDRPKYRTAWIFAPAGANIFLLAGAVGWICFMRTVSQISRNTSNAN
jgi:hypothetical protein